MGRREGWLLYLDESGSFEPGKPALVAGWLVRDFEAAEGTARLRRTLELLFPLFPYPPHASELKIPAARLAGAASIPIAPSETPEARRLREVCEPALRALDRAPEPFRRALDEHRWPTYDALRAADAWLAQEHRAAHALLQAEVATSERRITALLRAAADFYAPDEAFVVGAAGVVDEPRSTPAPRSLVHDGYVDALEATLERAVALLRSRQLPERAVWMRVLTRHVQIAGMGRLPLNHLHVAELAASAARTAIAPGREVSFRSSASINRWSADVHPGCVIADLIANRLYGLLHRAERWSAIREGAQRTIALPLEAVARMAPDRAPLPTLAATGEPRRALERAARERTELGPTSPPWAAEQAAAWLAAHRAEGAA